MALNGTQQKESDRLKLVIDIALDATDGMETYQEKDQRMKRVAFSRCLSDLLSRSRDGFFQLD